jgi:hypothetical protein
MCTNERKLQISVDRITFMSWRANEIGASQHSMSSPVNVAKAAAAVKQKRAERRRLLISGSGA